jgi:acetyltransferase-like isoleucine patch superfamily enzyme
MDGKDIPVIRDWDFSKIRRQFPGRPIRFLCGLGNPVSKRILVHRALSHGLEPSETLVGKDVVVRPDCSLGWGGVVHLGSYLSNNVRIGDYVSLFSARIGHDCVFANYCTCTLSNLAGHVTLDEGAQLGVGVSVRERIYIAPWTLVGIQSAVIKDINEPGTVAVGVPLKKLREVKFPDAFLKTWPEGWLQRIKGNGAARCDAAHSGTKTVRKKI